MAKDYDVLVAGEINPDLILSDPELMPQWGQAEVLVEKAALTIGSSNAIFACGAARLGLRVAFVGVVGDDVFGRFMLEALEARRVDVSNVIVDPQVSTGFSVILDRVDDRAILTHMGAIERLRAEQVGDGLLGKARHLHVASYFLQKALQPGLPGLLRRARGLGLTTSLDTNWDPAGEWAGFDELLSLCDVFLPNRAEALALARAERVETALTRLSQGGRTVAIKLGEQGAIAQRGDEVAHVPALAVQVADTVGAGDSFDAGFVYGYLQGWELERSLGLAVACGSLSARAHGGTAAQPTLAEALGAL